MKKKEINGEERGPFTNADLFLIINEKLREKGLLPDILDYSLQANTLRIIDTYEWDTIGRITFGCEGIYLDLYAEGVVEKGCPAERVRLGVYKTLDESKDAYKTMGNLMAEFVFELRDFVNGNLAAFTWFGYDVKFFNENSKYLWGYSECPTLAEAKLKRDTELRRDKSPAKTAVIIENSTGKTLEV